MNLARIIGVLAATAVLCACSAIKLGYNNLNEVAYWWLDGYVDFSDAQSPRARDDLARLHAWHRATELPRYAELLQKMERLAPGEVSAAQACGLVTDVRERLKDTLQQAEPAAVTLALVLGPEQLAHLERKYRKVNADYRKEWLQPTPGELAEKRFKQALERSEMVYGRLDEPQRTVLRQQIAQSSFDAARTLLERERRQQDALQTLRKVAAPGIALGDARSLVRDWLERGQESPVPGYRRYQDSLIQEGCRSFAATHNATNPAQRDKAVQQLRAWQRDLRDLAAQR